MHILGGTEEAVRLGEGKGGGQIWPVGQSLVPPVVMDGQNWSCNCMYSGL